MNVLAVACLSAGLALALVGLIVCAVRLRAVQGDLVTLRRAGVAADERIAGLTAQVRELTAAAEQVPRAPVGRQGAVHRTVGEPPDADVPSISTFTGEPEAVDLRTSRVASVTFAGPLIKAAAVGAGVRRALDDETRMRAGHTYRKELKRQRRSIRRERARSGGPAREGWRP